MLLTAPTERQDPAVAVTLSFSLYGLTTHANLMRQPPTKGQAGASDLP